MKATFKISVLLTLFCIGVNGVSTEDNNQQSVDYYVNLISKRSVEAENYEFLKDARMHEAEDKVPSVYGVYDFVIVGAGAAGSIIAHRLSEIKKWKILLLEAGTYRDDDLTGIPSMWILDSCSKFNWGFESIPQKYGCLGNPGQKCFVPKGKGVGGSTLISGMAMTKGNKLDYGRWSDLLNDPSWNYTNVLPYFKKWETFIKASPLAPIDRDYHGYDGPLHMTQSSPPQSVTSSIFKASQELGYNITDYNGKQQEGASIFQFNIKNGWRHDFATAFLNPVKYRKNLEVLDKSYVIKIDICNKTKTAKGVIFTRQNKTYIARARKEVILSAGVISSPQILLLSGVGPKDHLEDVGIPVITNLPVGKNLRDQTLTYLQFSTNITSESETLEESVQDLLKGQGSLTRPFLYEAAGWFSPIKNITSGPQFEFIFFNLSQAPIVQRFLGWSDETLNAVNVQVPSAFGMILISVYTKSLGTVQLKSSDPFEYPLIDFNILSEDEDVEVVYQGIQMALNLSKTDSFRSINMNLASDQFPSCNHTEPLSKEYWYCFIRSTTSIANHNLGTCPIGPTSKSGVVDKNLKVFGVKGLRVADSSIIPFPIGVPNSVTAMVGEKASDLFKNDYGY